ncbi:hypothetical protein AXF42_Ash013568 [Apostasia shenzhenica]|uniref:FAD synthase n=1 Tax=Apostasia shenzhenica TaxID=1088818 RepID=A0A2I0AP96_9ASPA|nr:hypothetical protein AXF42_Ash013568 [Apostasia shenzhenica]
MAIERGGGLLRISPWIPSRSLLTSAGAPLLSGGDHRSHCCPAKPSIAERFRSFPSWRESYHAMYNALRKSQTSLRSFCSYRLQVQGGFEEMVKNKFQIDCGTDEECVTGGIVALGKFDALHVGHRELAMQASKIGIPFLLSFVGMAEILGWEPRPPIVAPCDRKRVLSSWAPFCGNVVPREYQLDFSTVRHLTPRQFVERLSEELRVAGVVAGENYRFGYKASGDTNELVRLCGEYGLASHIVCSVMDKTEDSYNGTMNAIDKNDKGQVSSTRVRRALAMRDMEYVAKLLGRKHRLVLMPKNGEYRFTDEKISVPKSFLLNQPPSNGEFKNCTLLMDDATVGVCKVELDDESITIEPDCGNYSAIDLVQDGKHIGIEFG